MGHSLSILGHRVCVFKVSGPRDQRAEVENSSIAFLQLQQRCVVTVLSLLLAKVLTGIDRLAKTPSNGDQLRGANGVNQIDKHEYLPLRSSA